MTILNMMLGTGRGGLEQAGFDYGEALQAAGISALNLISPEAWIAAPLSAGGIPYETLVNKGRLDLLAPARLRRIAERTGATAIICHGNRALWLALKALKGRIPVIAVAHNYSTARFKKADACFAITHLLTEHLKAGGAKNVHRIPNMVRIPDPIARPAFRSPPVIGSMGRMIEKKGFRTFVEALSLLRANGVEFRAILGGAGEDGGTIDELIQRYQLTDYVVRTGWVADKPGFFASLDIFVLPSLEEAFGIVLIEAMSHALPVISSDAPGPREIITHEVDGLIVPKKNPEILAATMMELLADPARATRMGTAGYDTVQREFGLASMVERLKIALAPYITTV